MLKKSMIGMIAVCKCLKYRTGPRAVRGCSMTRITGSAMSLGELQSVLVVNHDSSYEPEMTLSCLSQAESACSHGRCCVE